MGPGENSFASSFSTIPIHRRACKTCTLLVSRARAARPGQATYVHETGFNSELALRWYSVYAPVDFRIGRQRGAHVPWDRPVPRFPQGALRVNRSVN